MQVENVFRLLARRTAGGLIVAGLLISSVSSGGCGNGLAEVTGVVTVDGQPVKGGPQGARVTVQFQPANGTGSTAIGLADADGRYVLGTGSQNGIPPGDYVVSCAVSELVAGGARSVVDRKYANAKTSGLRFSVQAGSNQCDIALASAPGGTAQARTP